MDQFPRSVFESPGKKDCQGGSFNSKVVLNEDELKEAVLDGWALTLPEALTGPVPVEVEPTPKPKRKYTRRVKNVD